jgi:hypothetical protein
LQRQELVQASAGRLCGHGKGQGFRGFHELNILISKSFFSPSP